VPVLLDERHAARWALATLIAPQTGGDDEHREVALVSKTEDPL
jgi:hypothetical protein